MSFAPTSALNTVIGCFVECEFGKTFEYRETNDEWAKSHSLTHEIFVTDAGDVRYAIVKKTVAHVAIDEDGEGMPVLEKWELKKSRVYNR